MKRLDINLGSSSKKRQTKFLVAIYSSQIQRGLRQVKYLFQTKRGLADGIQTKERKEDTDWRIQDF